MADAAAGASAAGGELRIVSLLPSITEIVAALGLAGSIVGVTHECDYPPEAVAGAAVVTTTEISPHTMSQAEIHERVQGALANGHSLYGLDAARVREARATHVLTQALCDVCAVSYPKVMSECARVMGEGGGGPAVVSLEPTSLEDVFGTFAAAGDALGARPAADAAVASLRRRLAAIESSAAAALAASGGARPRVCLLEWCDPLFTGGHWVPDMVAAAGGAQSLARSGERSRVASPEELAAFAPEVVVVAPCGFGAGRAAEDAAKLWAHEWWRGLPAVKAGRVYAADANSYFARPGPRLVDGVGVLVECVWGPEALPEAARAPEGAWVRVRAPAGG